MGPYQECTNCIAIKWCKKYTGEIEVKPYPDWCSAHFRLNKAIELSNIPKRYHRANLHECRVDDDNREAIEKLKPYFNNIVPTFDGGKNFLIFGEKPGTGKTYLATTLLNQYIYKTCLTNKFDFENPLAYSVNYSDLMDLLRYQHSEEETEQLMKKVMNTPVLLLDDIASGTSSNFTVEQTYLIMNHRFNNNLSTVATTNITLKNLGGLFGARSMSRLLANCEIVKLEHGKDRRFI